MIERGSAAFWHTSLALFAAGMATFALLYCVQPLMPVFSAAFGIGAAESSLCLSATTLVLAVALLGAGALSDRVGRKPVMVGSVALASVLCGVSAAAPSFGGLVAARAAMGLALAGLPAVAMAYVSEEMSTAAAGLGMGLYIGGSAIGGMSGRLLAAWIAQEYGWRAALAAIAALGLACFGLFWRFLPPSRHARRRATGVMGALGLEHWRNPALPFLFALGFLLMGGFVSVYNYVGYRLLAPPYGLSQRAVGLIFTVYLVGVASSAAMGGLALRIGRRLVLMANIALMATGLAVTLLHPVWAVTLGVAGVTAGFFGAHSVASAWVGFRAATGRAQASSLYLLSYYAGSSLAGSTTGLAWARGGWNGVAACTFLLLAAALGIAARLPAKAARPASAWGSGAVTVLGQEPPA